MKFDKNQFGWVLFQKCCYFFDPPASKFRDNEILTQFNFLEFFSKWSITEVYPGLCQTSKIKRLAKIVNNFKPLTIFAKHSILDV